VIIFKYNKKCIFMGGSLYLEHLLNFHVGCILSSHVGGGVEFMASKRVQCSQGGVWELGLIAFYRWACHDRGSSFRGLGSR